MIASRNGHILLHYSNAKAKVTDDAIRKQLSEAKTTLQLGLDKHPQPQDHTMEHIATYQLMIQIQDELIKRAKGVSKTALQADKNKYSEALQQAQTFSSQPTHLRDYLNIPRIPTLMDERVFVQPTSRKRKKD